MPGVRDPASSNPEDTDPRGDGNNNHAANQEKQEEAKILLPEGMGSRRDNSPCPSHKEAGVLLPEGLRNCTVLLQPSRSHPPVLPDEPALPAPPAIKRPENRTTKRALPAGTAR